MFRRTFTIVFKPVKNNYILLPEVYFKLVNTYESCCLNLTFNNQCHYGSWAPYSSNVKDHEIGMNRIVAESLDLKEGSIVKCCLVSDVPEINSVIATAVTKSDWEMLEMTSNRIQSTILDQTQIIYEGQKLPVWINSSIHIELKLDKLSPNTSYGRLKQMTEISIAPYTQKLRNAVPTNRNYKLSHCQSEMIPIAPKNEAAQLHNYSTKSTSSDSSNVRQLNDMLRALQKDAPKSRQFRVLKGSWNHEQLTNLTLNQCKDLEDLMVNQVFTLSTNGDREYLVTVNFTKNGAQPVNTKQTSIVISDVLMKLLGIEPFEKIILKPKNFVLNFIDSIELHSNKKASIRELREIEENFKTYIIENSKICPIVLNQYQIFKLRNNTMVTVTLLPESFKFCVVDSGVLREAKIEAIESIKNIDDIVNVPVREEERLYDDTKLISIAKFNAIADECIKRLKLNLCLDWKNNLRKPENIIIVGPYNSGKSVVCGKILHALSENNFDCYFDIFYCARNKGRKPDSIHKDLRQIFINCVNYSPSILILDNLDMLAKSTAENNQESDYFNRISDIIHNLIREFTVNNSVSVIATVTNISNVNKRIYTSRGRHEFRTVFTIPNLEKDDRELIIKDLCQKCKIAKNVDWSKFAHLTEGYKIGDLVIFVDRALFYAFRQDSRTPILSDNIFMESLKSTNTLCMHGIENHQQGNDDEDKIDVREIGGLDDVVEILEEVLIWPTKFPKLFSNSPLRNQAGVLLFGPPGTGKTYLVSQIAKTWNLRMISVKGPELLAKYIGQSEENVRNLFDKARSARPCVLFFDEFDSLAPRRGHDSTGVTDRVVNQFLTELDGVESLQGVTVIAATSRPELLDPALLRSGRIDRLVECHLPDLEAREIILENLSDTLNLEEDVDLELLSRKTENYTGADLKSILTSANMIAVKECLAEDSENVPDEIIVTQEHIDEAFENTRPSLSLNDIRRYALMYAKFTNKESTSDFKFVSQRATLA